MLTRFFLIVMLSLGLTGCGILGPRYNKIEVKDTEVVKIKIQEELLVPCVPEKPLSKEDYLKLQPHERESYLSGYSIGLLGTVKDCNIKLKKIKEFSDAQ